MNKRGAFPDNGLQFDREHIWHPYISVTDPLPVYPVVIGGEEETMTLSAFLENRGIMATGIRLPTVEAGQSRIRLTLTALHTRQRVQAVINAFKAWSEQHGR